MLADAGTRLLCASLRPSIGLHTLLYVRILPPWPHGRGRHTAASGSRKCGGASLDGNAISEHGARDVAALLRHWPLSAKLHTLKYGCAAVLRSRHRIHEAAWLIDPTLAHAVYRAISWARRAGRS
jgi:hypothetical protein